MIVSRTLNFAVIALLGSAVHLSGFAQASDVPAQATQHHVHGPHATHMDSHAAAHSASIQDAKRQKHLETLKASLQIQSSQESAWLAFNAAMTQSHKRMNASTNSNMSANKTTSLDQLTTPERIDKMMQIKSERHAEMSKRIDAIKTFYAALTPAQQKEFDKHSQKFMKGGAMERRGKMHS